MTKNKAITYSLLAHIRNTGTLAKGPIDIFIPLIKRVLSILNSRNIFQGKSLLEIKELTDELYAIDFPIPVLKKILLEICKEINTEEKTYFTIHKDNSFSINQYTFSDYEELIENQVKEIEEIESLFKEFCKTSELKIENSESIFKFIEKNKFNLSKYISHSKEKNGHDYTAEAQFVSFFKQIPQIYEKIKNIYLGSIIAGYIEYEADETERNIELLIDTNFVVGLIDLNTPESTHTCRTLVEIAQKEGFKVKILKDTIEETKNLLEAKANYFDKSFLQKKVNPEDVYNACDRRKLNKADLERIADNLEDSISKFGIYVIHATDKLRREAKFTPEYKSLEKVRHSKLSAIHDASAILYIQKKRGKRIKEFDKVNAWFVNNSASNDGESIFLRGGFQPESIKADDLLNILWLSNPKVNSSIDGDNLAEIGLTTTLSITLNENLPKSKILRELDDNIHKYAQEEISDTDIVRVATRITNKQLENIEELNALAESDKAAFVKRLEEESQKQKNIEESRIKKLEELFTSFSIQTEELEKTKKEYEGKSSKIEELAKEKEKSDSSISELEEQLLNEKNETRRIKREAWIDNEVKKWRNKSWNLFFISLALFICIGVYLLYQSNWVFDVAIQKFKNWQSDFLIKNLLSILSFLFMAIVLYLIKDKYWNHSNVKSFKSELKIPEELREIKKL